MGNGSRDGGQGAIPPSAGERNAMSGYRPQYAVAAELVIAFLRDRRLERVRIADPEAGHVDDIVLFTPDRVDAFQVKWHRTQRSVTFNGLVQPRRGDSPLIRQLAAGWQQLREAHQGHRTVVHLLTDSIASVNSKTPDGGKFTDFLGSQWLHEDGELAPANETDAWSQTWTSLRAASGIDVTEWPEFRRDLRLWLGFADPADHADRTRDALRLREETDALRLYLQDQVSGPCDIVELSAASIFKVIGAWPTGAVRRHDFPDPPQGYEPVEKIEARLRGLIENTDTGYLALVGSPGSGKSTLLTHLGRSLDATVVMYRAFVRGDTHDVTSRAESSSFFFDMTQMIGDIGFGSAGGMGHTDRDVMRERFLDQLRRLGADCTRRGRKAVLIIDGLDHIVREGSPHHAFPRDLPPPEALPNGVLVLVGTQSVEASDLPTPIALQLSTPSRTIEMAHLSAVAVARFVDRWGMSVNREQKLRIFQLSDGHPLALTYLLLMLEASSDSQTFDAVLADEVPFQGEIDKTYDRHFEPLKTDDEAVDLLGVVCRLRGPIDWEWLETWCMRSVVLRMRDRFRTFLQEAWFGTEAFFHNSFRLYLLRRTGESVTGTPNPSRDREFHRRIADACKESQPDNAAAGELLYHLHAAGEHHRVVELATPEWLRGEVIRFRPMDEVLADCVLAARSALMTRDVFAFARTVLAGHELLQRAENVNQTTLCLNLLRQRHLGPCLRQVFDGRRSRLEPEASLLVCRELFDAGEKDWAHRLFDAAEPSHLLTGLRTVYDNPSSADYQSLVGWARVATCFRDVGDVLAKIMGLEVDAREGRAEEATRSLRSRLLRAVGRDLADHRRWEAATHVAKLMDEVSGPGSGFWVTLDLWISAERSGNDPRTVTFADMAAQTFDPDVMPSGACIVLAEMLSRAGIHNDKVNDLLRRVHGLRWSGHSEGITSQSGLDLTSVLRRERLHWYRGTGTHVDEAAPELEEPRRHGGSLLERAVCLIAQVWGRAWAGEPIEEGEISPLIADVLRMSRNRSAEVGLHPWQTVEQLRPKVYAWLSSACAAFGQDALRSFREVVESEWSTGGSDKAWSPEIKRGLWLAIYDKGAITKPDASSLVQAEPPRLAECPDVYSRSEACLSYSNDLVRVGLQGLATEWLAKAIDTAFGLGYRKDYQLDEWISVFGAAIKAGYSLVPASAELLALACEEASQVTEGRAAEYASQALVSELWQWSPLRAVMLASTLYDRRALSDRGFYQLLARSGGDGEEEDATDVPQLSRKERDALSLPDVIAQCDTLAGLDRLLIEAEEGSFFPWDSVLGEVALPDASILDAYLNRLCAGSWHDGRILATAARRALELGDTAAAWEYGTKVFQRTNHMGWWGGGGFTGVRVEALEVLMRVDRDLALDLAYGALADEMSDRPAVFTALAWTIRDTVRLLAGSECWSPLWDVVKPYVASLIGNRSGEEAYGFLYDEPIEDTPEHARRYLSELT